MNEILTLAIIGHLVGDYILQNDWMASNKKKDSYPCAVHCLLWTASVLVFSGWLWSPYMPIALMFLWITHFIQDRTQIVMWWMTKVNRQHQFATGPCAPWSIIVVDNTWHILALLAVWRFI